MKIRIFTAALLMMAFIPLSSLEISLAKIGINEMFDESKKDKIPIPVNITGDLADGIASYDRINSLQIKILEGELEIGSLLDASTAAFDRNCYYMLYGDLYVEERWMEARISLYELETDRIRTIFYGKADITRYDDLVRSLTEKIVLYFYDSYGIEPAQVFNSWDGYWEVGGSLGYWGVLPDWNNHLTGITSLQGNLLYAFNKPVFFYNHFVIYPRAGIAFSYQTGLNKPDFENFVYNSFQLAIPLEICAEWRGEHFFSFQFYPGDQIDWLVQSRLYGETYNAVSQALFLTAGLTYQLLPAESPWIFGVNQRIDFVFYRDLMVSYKPSIQIGYRLERKKHED